MIPINTDPTKDKIEFHTINGMAVTLSCLLGEYDALANTMVVVGLGRGFDRDVATSINDQMINSLIALHNYFQRITGWGDFVETVKNIAPPTRTTETSFAALPFIRGVLSDPWLYSSDEFYQQAAVLGLRKAQTALHQRIEYLTK